MRLFVTMAAGAAMLLTAGTALARTAEEAAGELVFHRCMACHSVDKVPNTFGPSLVGVVGRKAGSLPDFEYSAAMKASGIVWSADTLRKWMANNDGFMPGTRMRHVAITDPAEQDYLLAFLRSLK